MIFQGLFDPDPEDPRELTPEEEIEDREKHENLLRGREGRRLKEWKFALIKNDGTIEIVKIDKRINRNNRVEYFFINTGKEIKTSEIAAVESMKTKVGYHNENGAIRYVLTDGPFIDGIYDIDKEGLDGMDCFVTFQKVTYDKFQFKYYELNELRSLIS